MKSLVATLLLLAAAGPAHAAACEQLTPKVGTIAKEDIVASFTELAKCDAKLGEKYFYDYMRASSDVGTLVSLSLAAIDARVYQPVWNMLEKVPDYGARDEVAKGVGAHCADHAEVLPFLKGAYSALGDRQFGSWREAYVTCDAPDLATWLSSTAAAPPKVAYDEKYNVVTDALAKRERVGALPTLEKAAVAAADGGPFSTVLDRMADAIRPAEFGGAVAEADQAALEEALARVAAAVPPDQARVVADRLYQAGAEEAAAALLPRIYPDRVQEKGGMLYGVAAVESCDGEAVVHYATVSEPAKRWSIVDEVTPLALAAFKSRLKCTPEGPWPIMTTPEPVADDDKVEAWAEGLVSEWSGKGLDAKSRAEKGLELP